MYRCTVCGHHHIAANQTVKCMGVTYDDDGGISRCHCHHSNQQAEHDQAA